MIATYDDFAKFLLRFTVGFLMIFHGIDKVINGIEGIKGLVTKSGLPEFFAYGVYVGEVLAPALLIIGLKTRLSAFFVMFTMIIAIYLAHMEDIFTLGKHGAWGIELQMFFLLTSLIIILQGPGKYSFDGK